MERWNGEWIAEIYVHYTDGSITLLTALANLGYTSFGPYPKFPEEVALDLAYNVQWYNVFYVNMLIYPARRYSR